MTNSRGVPHPGVPIRVVHRSLRQDVLLGRATTDLRGDYSVTYSVLGLPNKTADIQVRAFRDEGSASHGKLADALAQSKVIYDAQPLERSDLRLRAGTETGWSEFQQVKVELAFHVGDVALDALEEKPGQQDLSLLAGKTKQPIKRLANFVAAHKWAAKSGVPAEALYGLISGGAGTNPATLMGWGTGHLARMLGRAADAGIISAGFTDKLDTIAPQLLRAAIKQLVADPAALGGALADLPDEGDRADFLTRLIAATGSPDLPYGEELWTPDVAAADDPRRLRRAGKSPDRHPTIDSDGILESADVAPAAEKFWTELAADPRYRTRVPDLQLKMQLAAVTNSHAPLVQALAEQIRRRAGTAGLKALAGYSISDFEAIINVLPEGQRVPTGFQAPSHLAADPSLTKEQRAVKAYAATLTNIIADAMPTVVLAHKVMADTSESEGVRTFFRNITTTEAEFDLRVGLTDNAQLDGLLDGVANRDQTIAEIASIKRLFNITNNYGHLTVLKSAGLSSARAIDELGAGVFIARYAEDLGGPTQALMYAEKAAKISAISTALYTAYSPMFNTMPLYALSSGDTSGRANLETMFGSIDACACADCQTVLSPAAYLAELLAWLGERRLVDGRTARGVLYSRRPDIGELELSCANADTPLPYIDLVNELLELAVAPIADVVLGAAGVAGELDAGIVSDQLRSAFAAQGAELTAGHEAFVVAADQHWFLTDRSTLWVIRRTGPAELTAKFGSYQTRASAEELAAEAEHERSEAYEQLRVARYPIELPLDLWTSQIQTYLGHLTEPSKPTPNRVELMRTLAASSVDPAASLDIATEQLGLTVAERNLISTAAPAEPWEDFGLAEHSNPIEIFDPTAADHTSVQPLDWVDALHWVRHLLDRSGLTYDELKTLLLTDFVNPGRGIRIESADPVDPASCNVSALILTGWNAAAASRVRRFTRLWRRLGWSARELDDLISALASGIADVNNRLDTSVLIALAGADRLHRQLGLPLNELPGFWAPLATARPDDQYHRLFSDPAVLRPLDEAFTIDPSAGPDLAIADADDDDASPDTAHIDLHGATILAALRLGATDLAALQAVLPDTTLNLANLSTLYRHARFARALALTVPELLALTQITDDPFPAGVGGPAAAVRFADLVAQIRSTGLTFGEIDYLVFHQNLQTIPGQPIAVSDDQIAASLDTLRGSLRTLAEQTTVATDPDGTLLTRALAGLRWPDGLIHAVIGALDGTTAYLAALPAPPPGLVVPAALQARLSHADGVLTIRGALTADERVTLLAASTDGAFTAAVESIFMAPRDLLATALKVFEWPALRVPLAALPTGLVIPAELRTRVYYDAPASQLVSKTPITAADAVLLAAASPDTDWLDSVSALLAAPTELIPTPDQAFLAAPAAAALVDVAAEPANRFAALLGPVLNYIRQTSGRRQVIQQASQDLDIPAKVADWLLGRQLPSAANPALPAINDFLADTFITSNADVPLTRAAFGAQFDSYLRVHKVAQVASRLNLTTRELSWLSDFGDSIPDRPITWRTGHTAGWWNPATVPVTPVERSAEPLAALLRIVDLDRLRDGFTEAALDSLLSAAREPGTTATTLLERFADAVSITGDPVAAEEITALSTAMQVSLPADFTDETGIARLRSAVRSLRRTGASAEQLLGLAAAEPTAADARAARQLVKAKYDDAGWRAVAKPLRDVLRRQQRTALLRYALSQPAGQPALFAPYDVSDEADLYGYLLIDSEMEPIMMTSRIAQATLSIQQFVQRCNLGLEPEVTVDAVADPGWNDWTWMSSYPLWAGGRRVFCFPEDVLHPALRDDKTPFFLELESALMQDDVTAEVAEEAFGNYLSRLDEVARLEILGLWDQPAVGGEPATLHVFGRTCGKAPKHYHRTRIDGASWTAWHQVDLDITEPQILPIVWNRRLYLFWPMFTEVTPDPKLGDPHFTLALAYSRFTHGKWQPKQLTNFSVALAPAPLGLGEDHGKSRFRLRAELSAGGPDLWIWPEWNDPDPDGTTVDGFHFTGADCQVQPYRKTIQAIREPTATTAVGMQFVREPPMWEKLEHPLKSLLGALELPIDPLSGAQDVAFSKSPRTFSLAYPHQDGSLTGSRTFVYQDGSKSYVVDPVHVSGSGCGNARTVHPGLFSQIKSKYYSGTNQPAIASYPIGPGERGGLTGPPTLSGAASHGTTDPVFLARADRDSPAVRRAEAALSAAERGLELSADEEDRSVVSEAAATSVDAWDYAGAAPLGPFDDGNFPDFQLPVRLRYVFKAGFHPYVTAFESDLAVGGVQRLLTRANQQRWAAPFFARYWPTSLVERPLPVENVDFEPDGTYQQYNWELFFHAPLLIATKLSANQRFADAQRWFHRIFDPTDTSNGPTPARFWQTAPLYEQTQDEVLAQRITDLLAALAAGTADPGILRQIAEWRADPFNPYAIARLRLPAFQKMVVMSYLDNLIAWADQSFRRGTRESINTAIGLYTLAGEILGRRPTTLTRRARPQIRTAVSLDADVDEFSNRLVQIEQVIGAPDPDSVVVEPGGPPLTWPKMLYFGVPANERLAGYWTTVADRLFKIRNSMNIEGVVWQPPLFEQPVDALLAQAAAAGIDLSSTLVDSSAAAPHYRFHTLAGQALAVAGSVRALGAAVLAALEKRDAETLAMLRATNERLLSDDIEKIRSLQESEATERVAVLRTQRAGAVQRYLHYQKLLGVTAPAAPAEDQPVPLVEPSANATIITSDGVKMLDHEQSAIDSMSVAASQQDVAANLQLTGAIFALIPDFHAEPGGFGVSFGGSQLAAMMNAFSSKATTNAAIYNLKAAKSTQLAQAVLREHDWVLQSNQAAHEIMYLDNQRLVTDIAKSVATAELENARMARDQSVALQEYLSTKYTNAELYSWMVTQVSALHFQAYQLAFDLAKKAERAMRRELGTAESDLIQFGYWDSLRKGLLAGEQLELAIQRMQSAYLDHNRRTYEITKHVSLAAVNPAALVDLREIGACYVQLPEALFDLDRPGDYQRRIKMVSVTIPAVTGPYTSINCRLTLLTNSIRVSATPATPYPSTGMEDTRFYQSTGGPTSIVTSTGRDDAGLFAPSFTDERFLPFEGEGVISSWRLELPHEFRQFDYQSISDVVLTIRYTALDGGEPLRAAAVGSLKEALTSMEVEQGRRGLYRLFSVRDDYPDAWQAMHRQVPAAADPPSLSLTIGPERFPFAYRGQSLTIDQVALLFRTAEYDDGDTFTVDLQPPTMTSRNLDVTVMGSDLGGLPTAVADLAPGVAVTDAPWAAALTALPSALVEQIEVDGNQVVRLKPDALEDVGILIRYTI